MMWSCGIRAAATPVTPSSMSTGSLPCICFPPAFSERALSIFCLEEGIVCGGGLALIQASLALDKADVELTDDEKVGFKIVKRALEEPIRQIAENAGVDGSIVADKAKTSKKGVGFDAYAMEWKDMMEAGIIDPAKVTRSALQNAASVASLLLTTECAITDIPEKNPMPAMPAGGMGDMGGMY